MKIELNIQTLVRGDGTETSFSLDLRKHPFSLSLGTGLVPAPIFDLLKNPPSNVLSPGGDPVWSLSGYILTADFGTAPVGQKSVTAILQFDT